MGRRGKGRHKQQGNSEKRRERRPAPTKNTFRMHNVLLRSLRWYCYYHNWVHFATRYSLRSQWKRRKGTRAVSIAAKGRSEPAQQHGSCSFASESRDGYQDSERAGFHASAHRGGEGNGKEGGRYREQAAFPSAGPPEKDGEGAWPAECLRLRARRSRRGRSDDQYTALVVAEQAPSRVTCPQRRHVVWRGTGRASRTGAA